MSVAYETGDTSKLNSEELKRYNEGVSWRDDGDITGWGQYVQYSVNPYGRPLGFDVAQETYIPGSLFYYNAFTGLPTDTMITHGSTLNTMMQQAYTSIILGGDASEFDAFVANWMAAGGEQITQEVNAWAAENPDAANFVDVSGLLGN